MATTKQYFKVKNGLEIPSQDSFSVSDNAGPSAEPTLLLDFANSKKLDPRISFSRDSTGYYYDGVTKVKAEENLLTYSQDFSNAIWVTNSATKTSGFTAPDGTSTAHKITGSSGYSLKGVNQGFSSSASGTYTGSVYAKADTHKYIQILYYGGSGMTYANFDLLNGQVGAYSAGGVASIASVGNGWYRCSFTSTLTTNTNFAVTLALHPRSARAAYTASTGSVLLWGAQLEQRSFVTAYTPTTSSIVVNYAPSLKSATAASPRFEHDPITGESKGLLIEPSKTNLFSSSVECDATQWNIANGFIQSNSSISPDGNKNSNKLIQTGTGANLAYIGTHPSVTITSGSSYIFSAYVKAGTFDKCYILLYGAYFNSGGANVMAAFNLTTGTKISASGLDDSGIYPVGNGWYRIWAQKTATTTITSAALLQLVRMYEGATSNSSIYVWGLQCETGNSITSYIPTTTTFTKRPSKGTYVSNDGFNRISGYNELRYDINGDLGYNSILESNSINYLKNSSNPISTDWATNTFTNGFGYNFWTVTRETNIIPPDGGLYSTKFVASASPVVLFARQNISLPTATTYVGSCYVYVPSGQGFTNFRLQIDAGDVDNASSTDSASFDCWVRLSTGQMTTTAARTWLDFNIITNNGTLAVPAGTVFYAWGFQLENKSVATSYIPSTETFSARASIGTFYDGTGILKTAPSGLVRYTNNPTNLNAPPKILLEETSINLLTYSEQFDNAAWTKSGATITANASSAPDGSVSADKLVEDTTNGHHMLYFTTPPSAMGVNTFSVFIKAGERTAAAIQIYEFNPTPTIRYAAVFDLYTGQLTSTTSFDSPVATRTAITSVGNGWYRCAITMNATSACGVAVGCSNSNTPAWSTSYLPTYTGTSGSGIYIWGAQLETALAETSYIPTTTAQVTRQADTFTSVIGSRESDVYTSSAVTRAADVVEMKGTNFSSGWYNNQAGTFICSYFNRNLTDTNDANTHLFRVLRTGTSETISARIGYATFRRIRAFGQDAGGTFEYTVDSPQTATQDGTISVGYSSLNDFAVYENGSLSGSDGSGSIYEFVPDILQFGSGAGLLNGCIKRLVYYPKRLANIELQALSQ